MVWFVVPCKCVQIVAWSGDGWGHIFVLNLYHGLPCKSFRVVGTKPNLPGHKALVGRDPVCLGGPGGGCVALATRYQLTSACCKRKAAAVSHN